MIQWMMTDKNQDVDRDVETRLSDVSGMSHETCSTVASVDGSQFTSASENQSQNIRVVTRIRPLSLKEQKENSRPILVTNDGDNSIQVDQNKRFVFDKVFHDAATQKEVYEQTAGDMIQNHLFKGFNVTVLAYGQTGSGKTHTVFGANGNNFTSTLNEETDGIIPRAVHDLFRMVENTPQGHDRIKIDMSFLEIYNEVAKDLLSNDALANDLTIRETSNGVHVKNLSRHSVISPEEVAALMISAGEKRSVASTLMNSVSSRSHAICTLYVTISPLATEEENAEQMSSKLTLVDLAGSERIKKTGAEGMRLKEGININKGLFVLGQVVSSLSELGQQFGSSDNSTSTIHVNYRDSKLTRLLQDSLGGNSKTVMVACVSPADSNTDETVNTLRYAERTRSIKNSAVRNIIETTMSVAEAATLRRENQTLKMKLSEAQVKLSKLMSANFTNGSTAPRFLNDQINGLGVRQLDVVTKLMLRCTAMEEKLRQYDENAKVIAAESLESSKRADELQQKCDSLVKIIEENGLPIPESVENDNDSSNLMISLREELHIAKEKLFQAGIDAEVSRATAAAVLTGNGDLNVAEKVALTSDHSDENEHTDDSDFSLSAQLHAVSGSIEQKEILFRNANQEHECLEAVRAHFENTLETLHHEVEALSTEKEELMVRMKSESVSKSDAKVRMLKQRIGTLEARLKELKQKAADHKKALRLREQAEAKVKKLEIEIQEDKKRRAALQRKLKEESVERRNERKEARNNATKFLRDSNRIKHELAKVKESAAKQEAVLKRKVELASQKSQRLEERSRKRIHPQSAISTIDISSTRQGDIDAWIEKELNENMNLQATNFMNQQFFQNLCPNEYKYACQSFFKKSLLMLQEQKKAKQVTVHKKKKEQNTQEHSPLETTVFLDDGKEEDIVAEDSDDSDWSPDTPAPVRKRSRKVVEKPNLFQIEDENLSDEENTEHYMKMTVNQLRELLRQSGLTVSGKKADLIKRLLYSARAKKALISPSCSDDLKRPQSVMKMENKLDIQSSTKKSIKKRPLTPPSYDDAKKDSNDVEVPNSTKKSLRKRPANLRPENNDSTTKRLKICQETISSSLRKRSPIASSASKTTTNKRRISPTSSSALKSKKTPPSSRLPTRSSRRISPPSENSAPSSKRISPSSANSATSTRSLRSTNKTALQKPDLTSKESKLIKPNRLTTRKRSDPLATITNSAKKRKYVRRASMKKSVNKALLQLEEQLAVL